MSETSHNSDAAAYVAHWARVGPLLEKVKRDELRSMSAAEHLTAIAAVLAVADPKFGNGPTSGLVEQQRLFARARR